MSYQFQQGDSMLTKSMESFILHWGEMGTQWGISRSVAQIHALLFLTPDPLNAEQISDTLGIARSNVSTSLKELQAWGLVQKSHVLGDRKDHFSAEKDCWEMMNCIIAERKKREIEPALAFVRDCMGNAEKEKKIPAETKENMRSMLEFLETVDGWYETLQSVPAKTIVKTINKMGKKAT